MSNFYTNNIKNNEALETTARRSDLSLLEPITRQIVLQIISEAHAHGLELMVFETYRSRARQEQLYDQGATKLKKVGVHHYGLACDIVKKVNGEPSWKGDFSLLGQLAHAHHLIWGGDWGNPHIPHSLIDSVHVQRCTIGRQASLFTEEWYPSEDYNPYND